VHAAVEIIAVAALRTAFAEAVSVAILTSGLAGIRCGSGPVARIDARGEDEHRNRQDKKRFHLSGYSTGYA
jgi:hypothetical protein